MLNVSTDDDAAADNAEDEVLPTGAVWKRRMMVKTENFTPLVPTVPGGTFEILFLKINFLKDLLIKHEIRCFFSQGCLLFSYNFMFYSKEQRTRLTYKPVSPLNNPEKKKFLKMSWFNPFPNNKF